MNNLRKFFFFESEKLKNHQHFEREEKVFHKTCVKLASNENDNLIQVFDTHSKNYVRTMIVFFTRQLFYFSLSLSLPFHHIKISNLFFVYLSSSQFTVDS